MAKPDTFLFDTSAFLALLEQEPGHDRVLELIETAIRGGVALFACFVSLTEVQYIVTYKRGGQAAAETLAELQALPVAWVHSDDALCANAAEIKALHRLSLADAFVAAAALRQDAVLVHRDAEFAPLAASVSQELLPPKTSVAASS
ncbi:MAG: PIN domain-containing protein [Verrucomicrobiota bacterium]|nr:PIN domain-containing protein [Verrucomicrobiota bacterium]